MDASDPRTPGPLTWLIAAVLVAIGSTVAVTTASGFMYISDVGTERVREVWPALLVSVLVGVATLALARLLIRRRAVSPWLGVGALPAAAFTLNHLGLVG